MFSLKVISFSDLYVWWFWVSGCEVVGFVWRKVSNVELFVYPHWIFYFQDNAGFGATFEMFNLFAVKRLLGGDRKIGG